MIPSRLKMIQRRLVPARQAAAMLCFMFLLGAAPIWALKNVPARPGTVASFAMTGAEAENFLRQRMGRDAARSEAFTRVEGKLKAQGKKRTSTAVIVRESMPAEQTIARRIAELIVPTLYAERDEYEYVILDDWSGYDPAFVGTIYTYTYWTQTETMVSTSFDKDPTYEFEPSYADLEYCNGSCSVPASDPESTLGKIIHKVNQAIYPTVYADAAVPGWWDRVKSWGTCTLGWCGGSAAGCFVGNVINAEILWVPCFAIGCTTAVIGCAVTELIP